MPGEQGPKPFTERIEDIEDSSQDAVTARLSASQARRLIEEAGKIGIWQVQSVKDIIRLVPDYVLSKVMASEDLSPLPNSGNNLPQTSRRRGTDVRWASAREAAGINPNDETANMRPSDEIIYRQLSEEKPVTNGVLAKALRPTVEFSKARASVFQALVRLRRILPQSINRSVINVGTLGHAEYLLVEVGKEQETIERYKKEEAWQKVPREALTAANVRITLTDQIDALLADGKEVTTDDVFGAFFEGKRTQNGLTQISRTIKVLRERAEAKGETILGLRKGGEYVYVRVRIDHVDRVRAEIGTQTPAHPHEPKPRRVEREGPALPAAPRINPEPTHVELVESEEESTGREGEVLPEEDILLEEDVEKEIQRPTGESSSIALRLSREDQCRFAGALVDFNGQYVLEELGTKFAPEELGALRRVANSVEHLPYSQEGGKRLQAVLNAAVTSPKEFLAQNGNRKWLVRALRKLSQDQSRGPGDVFWEIYDSMRPRY